MPESARVWLRCHALQRRRLPHELTFAERLVTALRNERLHPKFLAKVEDGLRRVRRALGGFKVSAGIEVEVEGVPDLERGTLSRVIESLLGRIEKGRKTVVIAIDELPELLLALDKEDHGQRRVEHLLHWLRSLRQTYRRRVRWILLGSIGLDGFVDERNLRKTINDLTEVGLQALTNDEAHAFLERLGGDNGLPLGPEVRELILQKIGWPLPYHLQLVFHALRELDCDRVTRVEAERAFAHLLRPESFSHFDTWRQRLDQQFSPPDAAAAKIILKHLCRHPEGRRREKILDALMTTRPAGDVGAVGEQLAKLLPVLLRDGYLIEQDGSYAFRSFLLREYWHRREVR